MRQKFRDAVQNLKTASQLRQAEEAIVKASLPDLGSVLKIARFSPQDFDRLVDKAIRADYVEGFESLLQAAGTDINHMLKLYPSRTKGDPHNIEAPLLSHAILCNAPRLALHLAARGDIDLSARGYVTYKTRFYASDYKRQEPMQDPLALAKRRGMEEVAAIIEARVSAKKTAGPAPAPTMPKP